MKMWKDAFAVCPAKKVSKKCYRSSPHREKDCSQEGNLCQRVGAWSLEFLRSSMMWSWFTLISAGVQSSQIVQWIYVAVWGWAWMSVVVWTPSKSFSSFIRKIFPRTISLVSRLKLCHRSSCPRVQNGITGCNVMKHDGLNSIFPPLISFALIILEGSSGFIPLILLLLLHQLF